MTPSPRLAVGVRIAAALEAGAFDGVAARVLERLWARGASAVRQVELPRGAAVIGVGGPTLGGSYKTPLVLALAQALAERGERVSVAAHGYRARLARPRLITPDDAVGEVGDEALWLARSLVPRGVAVVAGGDRGAAIRLAASYAPRVLVDALLQTRPVPLALSLLAVDGEHPWGARRCPPAGDLRATEVRLRQATDRLVQVDRAPVLATSAVKSVLLYADAASGVGAPLELARLSGTRVGVVTAIARTERVLRSLESAGVTPAFVRRFRDHDAPRGARQARGEGPVLWLTTQKCATKMGARFEGADVWVLRHELSVPLELVEAVASARPRKG